LIEEGKLDKKGKPTPDTPKSWLVYYQNEDNNNFNAPEKPLIQEIEPEAE